VRAFHLTAKEARKILGRHENLPCAAIPVDPIREKAVAELLGEMRTSKYGVAPASDRTVDGIRFDSKAEMQRWFELQLLQRAGQISDLARQPTFQLIAPFTDSEGKHHRGVRYVADFIYSEGGRIVVEDVKGVRTAEYRIKRQLFAMKNPGILFREVRT
jgi:hypothetical protein